MIPKLHDAETLSTMVKSKGTRVLPPGQNIRYDAHKRRGASAPLGPHTEGKGAGTEGHFWRGDACLPAE